MVVDEGNADAVRAFTESHGTIVTKEPVGQAGTGVHRYHAADIDDWDAFHRACSSAGELLIEEVIVQHADLAAVCPGTVNTTRVTAFFDGEKTHILAVAQKFGRGAVSDQMTYGGVLHDARRFRSCARQGLRLAREHPRVPPRIRRAIADFRLPLMDEVVAFVDRVARVVPQVQYVGWDIVVTPTGPVLVEGNWAAGRVREQAERDRHPTGHKPRYRAAIGFEPRHARPRTATRARSSRRGAAAPAQCLVSPLRTDTPSGVD